MSFENVKYHALSENSKISKRIIGFISFKWVTEYGTIGFNSLALMDGVKGLCVSFPHDTHKEGFDFYYFTGELKEELTRLAIIAYEDWQDLEDEQDDYVDTLDGEGDWDDKDPDGNKD